MWYIQENALPDPNNREIQIYKQDWHLPEDVFGDKCLLVVRSLFCASHPKGKLHSKRPKELDRLQRRVSTQTEQALFCTCSCLRLLRLDLSTSALFFSIKGHH